MKSQLETLVAATLLLLAMCMSAYANVTPAAPLRASDITYVPTEITHASPAQDLTLVARAPPIAMPEVAITGGVTPKQGSDFASYGQQVVAALIEFASDLNATNRTPRTVGNLQGGPLENATQVRGRFDVESGPANGTVYRADNQGNITSYATDDENGQILTRVDVTGAAHNGIPTPHTAVYGRNTLPDGSVRVNRSHAETRPATGDEIP